MWRIGKVGLPPHWERAPGPASGDELGERLWFEAACGCRGVLSPAATIRLKKRLFLNGPAYRAQMLAKAHGRCVLALRKVGAELYLAA